VYVCVNNNDNGEDNRRDNDDEYESADEHRNRSAQDRVEGRVDVGRYIVTKDENEMK